MSSQMTEGAILLRSFEKDGKGLDSLRKTEH